MGSIDKLAGAPSLPLTSPMTLTQEATSLRGSQLLRASVKISDTWMVSTWPGAWSGRPTAHKGFLSPAGPVPDWKGVCGREVGERKRD